MATRASARNFASAGPQRGNSGDARANDRKKQQCLLQVARDDGAVRARKLLHTADAEGQKLRRATGRHRVSAVRAGNVAHREKSSLSMEGASSNRSFELRFKPNTLRIIMSPYRAELEADAKRNSARAHKSARTRPAL